MTPQCQAPNQEGNMRKIYHMLCPSSQGGSYELSIAHVNIKIIIVHSSKLKWLHHRQTQLAQKKYQNLHFSLVVLDSWEGLSDCTHVIKKDTQS